MRTKSLLLLLTVFSLAWGESSAMEKVTFKAADGLEVVADLYMIHEKSAPFIILFHQANWSRGEYMEIATTPPTSSRDWAARMTTSVAME